MGMAVIVRRGLVACAAGWLVGCGSAAATSSSRASGASPTPGTHGDGGVQLSLAADSSGDGWSGVRVSIESADQCSATEAAVDRGSDGASLADGALVWTFPAPAASLTLPVVPTGDHCFAVAALDPTGAVTAVGRVRAQVAANGLSQATVALVPLH